ncbi:MAG: DUF1080 domain-containing protein [Tepidisphaeraceae bacterium]|jgi:hypothetical protein
MKRLLVVAAGLLLAGALWTIGGATARGEEKPAPKPDADGLYALFDGKTLDGWKVGKGAEYWKVEDGQIVTRGGPSHLFYDGPLKDHDFKNFYLKAEVMTRPHANSGIYFHTKYQEAGWPSQGFEAQVNATHSDPKKTGGLYNIKDVMNVPPHEDDKWFIYEILVEGKHVVLKVDGKVTCDWTEPDPAQPPSPGRIIKHGTIALQGHDPKSETHFKSILIKPLPD